MSSNFLPGAEPLSLEGTSNQGCLLLHGAGGGTAWDLKEFAILLNKQTNMTIRLPTLKGFGTTPEELYEIGFQDWYQQARDEIVELQASVEDVFIVGHSFGGIIALLLAAAHPSIAGISIWSTPFSLKSRLFRLLPLLRKIPGIERIFPDRVVNPAPEQLKKLGWISYEWIPSSLGFVIFEGFTRLKVVIQEVSCPTLIVQGEKDELIQRQSARRIFDQISSIKKEVWIIENGHHPLMLEPQFKVELFDRTISFLLSP